MRTLVLDPGGEPGVRAAINLTIEPSEYSKRRAAPFSGRAAFGRLITGEDSSLVEITFKAMVSDSDYIKVLALAEHASRQIELGKPIEIVMYDLFEPYVEQGPQSRAHVPNTGVVTAGDVRHYYAIRVGAFELENVEHGPCPIISAKFTESFAVTYDMIYG